MEKHVIFFDDLCVLCSGSVKLIHRNDPKGHFAFAPVDSQLFRSEVVPRFSGKAQPDSIMLLSNNRVYSRSAAALRIAIRMKFPWPLFGIFFVVPRFLRDPVYNLVARNRYRWFGKRDRCFVPDPALGERFII